MLSRFSKIPYAKNSYLSVTTHRIMLPLFSILVATYACTNSLVLRRSGETCLESEIERLEGLPEKQLITTLDGQEINLEIFFAMSSSNPPGCSLPHKFYYWYNDVKEISSKALERKVSHQIRAYYNLMSTCYPERIDVGRIYGDVAEFYDEQGAFMGFAVYLGYGLYCPFPYSEYTGPSEQLGPKFLVNAY